MIEIVVLLDGTSLKTFVRVYRLKSAFRLVMLKLFSPLNASTAFGAGVGTWSSPSDTLATLEPIFCLAHTLDSPSPICSRGP